jgi:hypothetical protein
MVLMSGLWSFIVGSMLAVTALPAITLAQQASKPLPGIAERPGEARTMLNPSFVAYIADAYLNPPAPTAEELGPMYAPRVLYYGREVGRGEVVSDKLRYYKRWPERRYELARDTLKVQPRGTMGEATEADVVFEYTFEVSGAGEVRRGRGVTELRIAADDGRLVINGERSRVLQRF